ncbi:MAG TPA: SGNH/GDSL hydrolase family protein [Candidatus Polarisedimenticolia bacterium]|nr:SGNH/GDSL hydrolase family protein [Candidatus Polarisedimenticolia bacterium]
MTLRRRLLVPMLLVALSLAVALLAGEAGVRLLGLQGREKVRVVPGRGITFEPRAAYRHVKEGRASGRFNGEGFRDRERRIEKPPDGYRILVLGDSFVEALQVELDEAFPAVLEDRLRLRPGRGSIEVLAMGQSGFGTASELMRYLEFGAAYRPDVVLLAFYAGNDVRDNSRLLSEDAPAFYYTLDQDGTLRLDRSCMEALERERASQGLAGWLQDESRLVSLVSERLYLWRHARRSARGAAAPSHAVAGRGSAPVDPRDDANVYLEDAGPAWREAWEVTGALLERFAEETAARGSRLAIVSVGTAEQVEEDLGRAVLAAGPGRDLDRPDRRLEAMAARRGTPCLLLAPGLRAAEAAGSGPVYGLGGRRGGHWNSEGHRRAALLLEPFLEEADLLPEAGSQAALGAARAFTAPSRGR